MKAISLDIQNDFSRQEQSVQQCRPSWWTRLCRSHIQNKLGQAIADELVIHDSDFKFQNQVIPAVGVSVMVSDFSFYQDMLLKGTLGAGESYIEGKWECNSLYELFRIIVKQQENMDGLDKGWAKLLQTFHRSIKKLSKNSLSGAKKNISTHYDLGNDFFQTFLDPTLCYSSALFTKAELSLEQASIEKMKRICDQLELKKGEHLLEIGSGWGGLAMYAAKNYDCKVTTITLSTEQKNFVEQKVKEEGLEGKVQVYLRDYREMSGCFDKIVSVEMIEAVGHEYHKTYMQIIDSCLKEGGLAMIQAILLPDDRYDRHLKTKDFIQQYIFPGSIIPSKKRLKEAMEKTKLEEVDYYEMGQEYAKTLLYWNQAFQNKKEKIKQLGYSEQFIRMWEYYLNYCAAGFKENYLLTGQILLEKK